MEFRRSFGHEDYMAYVPDDVPETLKKVEPF